jgi:hypothetical protein
VRKKSVLLAFAFPGMNTNQRIVRWLGLFILVLMALFPPWQLSYQDGPNGNQVSSPIGYHPLWYREAPVTEPDDPREDIRYRINLVRLGIQLGVVLILMNAGVYLLKKPPQ